jgi:hypothetical protein
MARVLTIGMLMTLAAAAGFYAHDYLRYNDPVERHFRFNPYQDQKHVKSVEPNQEFVCQALVYTMAGEDIFGDHNSWAFYSGKVPPPDAAFISSPASDHFALRISDDGKGIYVLGQVAFETGTTNGDMMPIISNGPQYLFYLFASDNSLITANRTLYMDKKTLRTILSFTGLGSLGIEGTSMVFECH